jgi:tripartite-type tricarboxylate transporter receptor subunit TctC
MSRAAFDAPAGGQPAFLWEDIQMTIARTGLLALTSALAGTAFCTASANADAVADFYKGKQIVMTMGTAPGGSFQVYTQALAAHMPKYIPGKPIIVPGFMPGAGGVKAANYLYAAAAQDGSQILMSHAISLAQKLQPKGVKFKAEKFQWLGAFSAITQMITVWHSAPVNSIEDAKKKELVMGAFSKNHLTYQWLALTNSTLGTKFKIVPGYSSGAKNNLAMEQGEIAGWTASLGNLMGTKADWLTQKKVKVLALFSLERMQEVPGVPTLAELASPSDRPVVDFVTAGTPISRALTVGPGVPAARVAALRDAFDKTMNDPAFLAEAKKRGLPIRYRNWKETTDLVRLVVDASPELVERVRKMTGQIGGRK